LDTNIVAEGARPRPDPVIVTLLERHQFEVAVAAPTWHELAFGVQRLPISDRRSKLQRYLDEAIASTTPILPYDQASAEWHADQRARLVGGGRTPAFVDGQIAAVAATNGLVLVTRNASDFADFTNLRVETWSTLD
jgi:tRNA(fMet)-specific endonuclease VapC